MKKTLKFAFFALLFLIGLTASAQINTGKSASTTLRVTLGNAYELHVRQKSVAINMNHADHFRLGNNSGSQIGHLLIKATTGYEVKVAAASELLNGVKSIPVSTVTVKPQLGAYGNAGNRPQTTDLVLTNQALAVGIQKTIISKETGEGLREYNVDYVIPANQSSEYLNKTVGVYTTTVTYSLYSK